MRPRIKLFCSPVRGLGHSLLRAAQPGRQSSLRWLSYLVPVWLAGPIFGPNLAGDYSLTGVAISFLWIFPIAVIVLGDRIIFAPAYRQRPILLSCVLLFLFVTGLTAPYSINPQTS